MGELIPIYHEHVVPGDKFRVNSDIFIRLAPMLAPIMHRVNVFTHYFFVPNRIVWDEWETFITGGEDGLQTAAMPYVIIDESTKASFAKGKLSDYFGIPITDGATIDKSTTLNCLPFRAYQEIYNEYYRDQNLAAKIEYGGKGSGAVTGFPDLLNLRSRAWEKDYFTSALPWPQRGADVTLPVTTTPQYKDVSIVYNEDGTVVTGNGPIQHSDAGGYIGGVITGTGNARIENLEEQQEGTSVTINELRNATRLQEWLEKNARGGSRYIEQILSHFGVKSSDSRLQRPEYLGGGKSPVIISEVLNQAGSQGGEGDPALAPVGEMSGHGVSVGKTNGFTKSFEEHGQIIGIMSVLPRTTYQQGLDRHWNKTDKLDFYWPEFAHLGEQEILNKEVYLEWNGAAPPREETFGYIPRYSEYKYKQSSVHGEFRDELDYWHMGRKFTQQPTLSTQFVLADPTHRIFAVEDQAEDKLYCQIYHRVSAIRPMPYYGTPYL